MTRQEKTDQLHQLIAEKSATADGFMTRDAMGSLKAAAKECRKQLAAGTLFREPCGNSAAFAYFSTPALAKAFAKRQQDAVLKKAGTLSFAKSPAGPCVAAEVIMLEGVKITRRLFADLRTVPEMPFLRVGQPGFKMCVGLWS